MAKKNELVGVDEEFIPKQENYTEESLIGDDTKKQIKGAVRSGTDYLASDESKEKIKNGAKKGWKIFKGVSIGYLIVVILIFVIAIGIIIFTFGRFISMQKDNDEFTKRVTETQQEIREQMEEQKEEQKAKQEQEDSEFDEEYENIKRQIEENRERIMNQ